MQTTRNKMTIQELNVLSSSDAKAIRELVKNLGSTYQELTDDELKQIIDSPVTHLIVARDPEKNRIIGMGLLALYRIPYLRKAYLDDFIVDDLYQGQGVGSTLMEAFINRAKESGAAYVELTSNPKRIGANKFYQKQGFVRRETNVYRLNFNHAKTK